MHRIPIGKNEAEVALIQNLNQELLFERIRIQMKYLKFKSKLPSNMAPIEPKPIITNQNFIKKFSQDAKVSLC